VTKRDHRPGNGQQPAGAGGNAGDQRTILDGSTSLGLVSMPPAPSRAHCPASARLKNGPGTFTCRWLNKMQRIEVNQGTLKLDSDYTFMGNGMFQAKVGGEGSYGQFPRERARALDGTNEDRCAETAPT